MGRMKRNEAGKPVAGWNPEELSPPEVLVVLIAAAGLGTAGKKV